MGKVVVLALMVCWLVSCNGSRKVQKSAYEVAADSATSDEREKRKIEKAIDTTLTEHGRITFTEIDFYPPTPTDTATGGKGMVRSIRQTVIESDVERKGESRESQQQEQSKCTANVLRNETGIQEHTAPAPYRWKYLIYGSILLIGVLLYLKRVPILNRIRKILAGIRRIF